MTALPDAAFLVLAEREKCGYSLRSAMKERHIEYCYMDDFYSGNISDIKLGVLMLELKPNITDRLLFNIDRILDTTAARLWIPLTEDEKGGIRRQLPRSVPLASRFFSRKAGSRGWYR